MQGVWRRAKQARQEAIAHRRGVENAHGYRPPGNSSNWGVAVAGISISVAMIVAGLALAIGFAIALTDPQAWVGAYLELKEFADTRSLTASR